MQTKKKSLIAAIVAGIVVAGSASAAFAQAAAPAAAPAAANAPAAAPASTPAAAPANADASSGIAAVYNTRMQGRRTASGERYNAAALTAAHNTLPFGTRVKITGEKNKRSVVARINDRGPTTPGRILDLSSATARQLGMKRPGLMAVKLEVLSQPAARVKAKKG